MSENRRRPRPLISMRACSIGLPVSARAGWLVFFGGSLLAVLVGSPDGTIELAAGFEDPFMAVEMAWDSLEAARADFIDVARLYRAGVVTAMITLVPKDQL